MDSMRGGGVPVFRSVICFAANGSVNGGNIDENVHKIDEKKRNAFRT